MKARSRSHAETFWPALVVKKWLNIKPKEEDFSEDERDNETDFDDDASITETEVSDSDENNRYIFCYKTSGTPSNLPLRRIRRGVSEMLRAQYIETKEIKISVSTWNVAGRFPPDDVDIGEWLAIKEPADIYVVGLQEVVPLNAGNVLGAEDKSPISNWETLIRKTLNQTPQPKHMYKSFSTPPSPVHKTSDASEALANKCLVAENDGLSDLSFQPERLEKESSDAFFLPGSKFKMRRVHSSSGRIGLDRKNSLLYSISDDFLCDGKLKKVRSNLACISVDLRGRSIDSRAEDLSSKRASSVNENLGLVWPEPSMGMGTLSLLPMVSSLEAAKENLQQSFKTLTKSSPGKMSSLHRSDRTKYVRIASKQMVGLFITIWVRRSLRSHVHNVKVSPVGVGLMGYMGNKGSISVSMSIYQTSLCLVCSHLTSGEKEGDELRRNYDVLEILRRTRFPSLSGVELPETILEHDQVIWFGDLNYRLNMSDDETRKLVAKEEWETLISKDQLRRELRKGHVFDGWHEGCIEFGPTYKYEFNSDTYFGEHSKPGDKRRTPAWCDRILWFGKGMKQISYNRAELTFSDHRPVNSVFLAEVEIFSHGKLQKALKFADADLEAEELMDETETNASIHSVRLGEDC